MVLLGDGFPVLDLLAVDLPFLLCFMDYLVLEFHFRSFPADLYHRVDVGDFHREWLQGLRVYGTSRAIESCLFVVGCFKHLVGSQGFLMIRYS